MTLTHPEIRHLLALMGDRNGYSTLRPGEGISAVDALELEGKLRGMMGEGEDA